MTRNKICVMDTETSGLTPGFNEVIQWSAICVDPETFELCDNVYDFRIKADHPERGEDAKKIHGKDYSEGVSKFEAIKEFILWIQAHEIRRVIPLGHNIQFDLKFLHALLMDEIFNKYINHSPRDTMMLGHIINDYHAFKGMGRPFKFLKLGKMAQCVGIPSTLIEGAHDSLTDCKITWLLYKELLKMMEILP